MAEARDWLGRAKSNLIFAKSIPDEDLLIFGGDIFFEDPCFELQQSVEKSLKAILVYKNVEFPKTHIISELLELLQDNNIEVPESIIEASIMTQYAVRTRYPEDFRKITEEEYKEAVGIAESVYNWAKQVIEQEL